MAYFFFLYRAPPGSSSLLDWESNLAEPLGTKVELQADLARLLPGLQWSVSSNGIWVGTTRGLISEPISLHIHEVEADSVCFLSVAAAPAMLRTIMVALNLTCCCASESGELRDPFAVGSDWSS